MNAHTYFGYVVLFCVVTTLLRFRNILRHQGSLSLPHILNDGRPSEGYNNTQMMVHEKDGNWLALINMKNIFVLIFFFFKAATAAILLCPAVLYPVSIG